MMNIHFLKWNSRATAGQLRCTHRNIQKKTPLRWWSNGAWSQSNETRVVDWKPVLFGNRFWNLFCCCHFCQIYYI